MEYFKDIDSLPGIMDRRTCLLQFLSLAFLAFCNASPSSYDSHVMIVPQSPVVEIGKNFTATCTLINTSDATADDLYWSLAGPLPREMYTKINDSAINVTIPITSDMPKWLICRCEKLSSSYVTLNQGNFAHGILFKKGYPPEKPQNLSCISVQEGTVMSDTLTCFWQPGNRGSGELTTKYTLNAQVTTNSESSCVDQQGSYSGGEIKSQVMEKNDRGQIKLDVFPHFMVLNIWMEAENELGKVQSDHLCKDSSYFVKTNPPSDVKLISEPKFATSLLMTWIQPFAPHVMKLIYQIRFCIDGSGTWNEVPLADTAEGIQNFRLQYLKPDTHYVAEVRCKHQTENHGYWSEWSSNATATTPEDKPRSKPDLWRIIFPNEDPNKRTVKVICKDPVFSNGKIQNFSVRIKGDWKTVNRSWLDPYTKITLLQQIDLTHKQQAYVEVTAHNSVGVSPKATMIIPSTVNERPPVEALQWSSKDGQVWLQWKPPIITPSTISHWNTVTEYVVEWISLSDGEMDWQRELVNTTRTAIKGDLEKFTCYNISVYPVYSAFIGKAVTTAAYAEQGAPLEGPVMEHTNNGRNEVTLVWHEIPLNKRRGFITNYTIFYSAEGKVHSISVSNDTHSYSLKSLSSSTSYTVWIMASTINGACNGPTVSFRTTLYGPGQFEGIVVGVSFSFLFLVVLFMFLCLYKKESIKRNFWPQIPDPGNSSIGTWSPDFPSKVDTPKENASADVSVVEVDLFDGKSVFEEDKTCLPLKKDKYLSEEHSSGIGGSSCMSSPRQSVSDSDEGGDSGQTTGSTVQYSSVVAASGYKGQTPSSQPQQHTFARSESTQPLLDSEENLDGPLGSDGSGHSHRFPRNTCFRHSPGTESDATELSQLNMEEQRAAVSLRFCPVEEGSQQTTPIEEGLSPDWLPSAQVSSYRPQLSGYRPQ